MVALSSEHGIVDARHEGCRLCYRGRHGQLQVAELAGSLVEVELVEDAVLPVACHGRPVLGAELTTLGKEPAQVGDVGDILGREVVDSPALYVGEVVQACECLKDRELLLLLLTACELIAYVILAHAVACVANGNDIEALTRLKGDGPIVLRHTCHDVVVCQRPVRTDAAVLYPHVGVLPGKLIVRQRILREDAGMGLAVVVHDVALVVDDVLDGYRRGNHLARGAEMVELATL